MRDAPRSVWQSLRANPLSAACGAYILILGLSYFRFGILFQYSLGLMFLAILPFTMLVGKAGGFFRELTPFLLVLLSYEALQGITGIVALAPLVQVVGARGLSTQSIVTTVQNTFYSPMMTDATTFLYSLHFPLIALTAVLLWYTNRKLYTGYMSSLVVCSYISLIFYVLVPTAPPWYNGVVANLLQSAAASSSRGFPGLVHLGELVEADQFAAFPSLHAAYAVLFAYFTTKLKLVYGLVSIPVMAGILFSTVYLGQHYLVDLFAGAAVAVVSTIVAKRMFRSRIAGNIAPVSDALEQ